MRKNDWFWVRRGDQALLFERRGLQAVYTREALQQAIANCTLNADLAAKLQAGLEKLAEV